MITVSGAAIPAGAHPGLHGRRQRLLFENGSDEYAKLKAQTTGTAVITLAYDANNSLQLTWQKVAYSVVEIAETDQILTVAIDCTPMYDANNGILAAVAKCGVDGICQ